MKRMRMQMAFFISIVLVTSFLFRSLSFAERADKKSGPVGLEGIKAFLFVARNYGLNYFLNKDIFEQYGWTLVITGASNAIPAYPPVADQVGIQSVIPDVQVSDISDIRDFDAVAIVPAAGRFNPVPIGGVL